MAMPPDHHFADQQQGSGQQLPGPGYHTDPQQYNGLGPQYYGNQQNAGPYYPAFQQQLPAAPPMLGPGPPPMFGRTAYPNFPLQWAALQQPILNGCYQPSFHPPPPPPPPLPLPQQPQQPPHHHYQPQRHVLTDETAQYIFPRGSTLLVGNLKNWIPTSKLSADLKAAIFERWGCECWAKIVNNKKCLPGSAGGKYVAFVTFRTVSQAQRILTDVQANRAPIRLHGMNLRLEEARGEDFHPNPMVNGPAVNGYAAHGHGAYGHMANGHISNGYIPNGHVVNGPIVNGPLANGPIANGPIANGYMTNGHIPNGYMPNGHIINGPIVNGPIVTGPIVNGHTAAQPAAAQPTAAHPAAEQPAAPATPTSSQESAQQDEVTPPASE